MGGLSAALFVGSEAHPRTIKLGDGTEHVLHFREVPAVDFRRYYRDEKSTDDNVYAASMAKLISLSVCTPEGEPAMTLDEAKRLKVGVMASIFSEVLDVNGFGKKEKKTETSNGSGTSSPSPSEDAP